MTYRRLVLLLAALAYIVFVCAGAYGQTSTLSGIVIGTNVHVAKIVNSDEQVHGNSGSSLISATVLVLGAVASYLRFFRGRTLSLRAELRFREDRIHSVITLKRTPEK